jgi:hypothetical protein
MSNESKQEYLLSIKQRYNNSSKKEKQKILDEFCFTCCYNRKYAIRILNNNSEKKVRKKGSGRKKKYCSDELTTFLIKLWKVSNLACSVRLKAMLPLWLPYYNQKLGESTKDLLLSISASSIDRILRSHRNRYSKLGLSTTKPGSLIRKQIPIKTAQWDESRPGFIEADTVAHCGNSVAGMFVYSLNTVDIATGWTEARALWGKGQKVAFEAIKSIEGVFPFKLLGFDSDNGGEFINWHLYSYFLKRKRPVNYTRSRAYQKNDNAHIEGKNWTNIRQYFGYMRFENEEIVPLMNDLYQNEWSLLINYFLPSMKLLSKERVDGRVIKKHSPPKTPMQRLIESKRISKRKKNQLLKISKSLNPFELQKRVEKKIKNVLNYAKRTNVLL